MQPSVLTIMTPFPITIQAETPLIAAKALMAGHDIKHLPVHNGDKVLAIISESDLMLAQALTDEPQTPIAALCHRQPLALDPQTTLKSAISQMASAGVDAAIVLRAGRLAGILTLTDVSQALMSFLPEPFVERPNNTIA